MAKKPTDSLPVREQRGDPFEAYSTSAFYRNTDVSRALAECKKAWDQRGYVPALMDALEICIKQGQPLPSWVAEQVLKVLDASFSRAPIIRKVKAHVTRVERRMALKDKVVSERHRKKSAGMKRGAFTAALSAVAEADDMSVPAVRTNYKRRLPYLGYYRPGGLKKPAISR